MVESFCLDDEKTLEKHTDDWLHNIVNASNATDCTLKGFP